MHSVFGFLILLAPLVVVHELGHFFFARLFRVKAEIFSVGFGPRLWSKLIGETEWRVSLFPLGGYVKLLGEDPDSPLSEAEKVRSLPAQSRGRRFWIFFGGPLFNFLFAIVIYMAILVVGEEHAANVVRRVVPGSPAALAGFKTGDQIVSVNQKPIRLWSEWSEIVSEHPGAKLKVAVTRGAAGNLDLDVPTESVDGYSLYGEARSVGTISGLYPQGRGLRIGVSDPKSLAAIQGFQTGDEIVSFNDKTLEAFEELDAAYEALASGTNVILRIRGKGGERDLKWVHQAGKSLEQETGLVSSELFLEQVLPGSPAEKAGLKAGDRILAVDGKAVSSFPGLRSAIQTGGETSGTVVVDYVRLGQQKSQTIAPNRTDERDPSMKKVAVYTIGIAPAVVFTQPVMVREREWNPFVLLAKGTERMVVNTARNFISIGKMFTGEVSVGTLGGPILIGKIAGDSLSRGLVAFLHTMALISIGLGVLNVLPVPVLDGGHIFLLGLESIRRRPLTLRQMEIIQQVGLSLIILLMIVVFKNDLTRLAIWN